MAGGVKAFLDRVEALPASEPAARQFDRLLKSPVSPTDPAWHARLFEALARHLLRAHGLRASVGAAYWEWAPLFRLERDIDPHYFAPRDIAERLAACPPMDGAVRDALSETLSRYIVWRRQGLQAGPNWPLLGSEDVSRWTACFPPDQAWASLDVLRAVGLHPPGLRPAWRAWSRFGSGDYDPPAAAASLREWMEACAGAPDAANVAAHRREFVAAAFGGAWPAMGLAGPCGDTPDCRACALRPDCSWGSQHDGVPGGAAEALASVRRDGAAGVPTERLWQVLFGLSRDHTHRLREHLERTPLRTLAGRSLPELEQWLAELEVDAREADPAAFRAERVQALFELARRFGEERLVTGATFRSAEDVFKHFRMRLRDAKQEHFFLVMLDSRRRYQGEVAVSQGTMDRALVHPRDVFGAAVRERAGAVLIVHNHPSGDPTPSTEDINVTKRLAEAGALIGIPLVDHIVIGEERYYSLSEQGLIPT